MALDALAARQAASTPAARPPACLVEQVEGAVKAQRRLAPLAVGDQHVAGEVGRVGAGRSRIGWAASSAPPAMPCGRKLPRPGPTAAVEPRQQCLVGGDHQQPLALAEQLAGDARDDLLRLAVAELVEVDAHRRSRSALEHVGDKLVEQAHADSRSRPCRRSAWPCPPRPCRRCRDAPRRRRRRRSAG